jgi:import inner membrane translocase subunit TIM22
MGETKPTRVVLRETWQLMKEKSRSYAKGFAGMGFLYSGTECMIERYRAKHDAVNATLAGCATGGLMAAPGEGVGMLGGLGVRTVEGWLVVCGVLLLCTVSSEIQA